MNETEYNIDFGATFADDPNSGQESGGGSPRRKRAPRQESGLTVPDHAGLEVVRDPGINELIELLRKPRQAVDREEELAEIAQRQDSVDRFFVSGGSQTIRRFFDEVRRMEKREPSIKLDLSMLTLSDKHINGLYLRGANLEGLVFTMSNISGSDLESATLNYAVAPGAIMLGITATGADWSNAVVPDADVRGSKFIGGTFVGTDMRNWIVDEATIFTGARILGCKTRGIDWARANTTGTVFRGNID